MVSALFKANEFKSGKKKKDTRFPRNFPSIPTGFIFYVAIL